MRLVFEECSTALANDVDEQVERLTRPVNLIAQPRAGAIEAGEVVDFLGQIVLHRALEWSWRFREAPGVSEKGPHRASERGPADSAVHPQRAMDIRNWTAAREANAAHQIDSPRSSRRT